VTETLSSAQARDWALSRPDPVADLISIAARLRHFERVDRLYYGEEAHSFALDAGGEIQLPGDAAWARRIAEPVAQLAEFRWVLNQFERAARHAYGSPTHCNALEYANMRRHALFEMAGLPQLAGEY